MNDVENQREKFSQHRAHHNDMKVNKNKKER